MANAKTFFPVLAACAALTLIFAGICVFSLTRIANTVHVNSNALSVIAAQASLDTLEEQSRTNALTLAAHITGDIEERLTRQENYARTLAAALTAIYSRPHNYQPADLPVLNSGEKPPIPSSPFISIAPGVELSAVRREASIAANCAGTLSMINAVNSGMIGVAAGTETGFVIAVDTTNSPNVRYDPRSRPWFTKAKEKNDIVWNDVYADIRGRGIIAACSVPFYEIKNGKKIFRGAVLASSRIMSLVPIMRTSSGITGNANDYFLLDASGRFLFDSEGPGAFIDSEGVIQTTNYLASSNPELAMIARKMVNQESGYIPIRYKNENAHIAWHPVRTTGWSFAVVFFDRNLFTITDNLEQQILHVAFDTEERTRHDAFAAIIVMISAACLFLAVLIFLLSRFYKKQQTSLNKTLSTEKNRISGELDIAAHMQARMIPMRFPPFPEHPYLFDIYGEMHPAKEIGGDFFDYFYIDDDHFAFVIADVSGKGISAALLMIATKILIKNILQSGYSIERAIEKVNQQACGSAEDGMFVSAWTGVLELSTGRLMFVNAGHNPPLLSAGEESYETLATSPDLVIGADTSTKYTFHELNLNPGDVLFLYTDGVTETFDKRKNMFGSERLRITLNKASREDFPALFKEIKNALDAWAGGGAEQFDDITMLAIRLRPPLSVEPLPAGGGDHPADDDSFAGGDPADDACNALLKPDTVS
jgi:sigma-B regulation protein RsbU (phosphoserine phosphatase)